MNRTTRHVSVDGQMAVRSCQSGSVKYNKYQDIEAEVEDYMKKWLAKKLVSTTVSSSDVEIKLRKEQKCQEWYVKMWLATIEFMKL